MRDAKAFFRESRQMFNELRAERETQNRYREAIRDYPERLERIATLFASGMLAGEVGGLGVEEFYSPKGLAIDACDFAEALMVEVDRRAAAMLDSHLGTEADS